MTPAPTTVTSGGDGISDLGRVDSVEESYNPHDFKSSGPKDAVPPSPPGEACGPPMAIQKEHIENIDPEKGDTATTATAIAADDDPAPPYSSFSELQKWGIVTLAAVGATVSPISSNIYVPAIPTLVDAFNTTPEKINLTVTVYLIFQALTPAFWGAAADAYGRRPVYIATVLIFTLACVGTALCPTDAYWLLVVMRIVQASGASATIAVGAGVISDVAMPQERGKYLGLFNTTSTFGPSIGPLLGGAFAYSLGWRSIFWFLTVMGGVILVPMVVLLPETLRSLVGDGRGTPPRLNQTPMSCVQHRHRAKAPLVANSKYNPLTSFLLLRHLDLLLILLWGSLYYALYYAVLTIFSTLLKDLYGFNEIIIGVCYISNGAGVAIGGIATGRIMDVHYKVEKVRVGGDHKDVPEFRLEQTRLRLLPWHAGIMLASSVALGWTMHYRVHVAVPVILNFVFGLGVGYQTTVTIFGIDLMPGQGGAVTASFNLTRCLVGAVAVGTVQLINRAMGAGWMFVLLAGICLLASPLPLIVIKYGPRWRAMRAARDRQKELEAAEVAVGARNT